VFAKRTLQLRSNMTTTRRTKHVREAAILAEAHKRLKAAAENIVGEASRSLGYEVALAGFLPRLIRRPAAGLWRLPVEVVRQAVKRDADLSGTRAEQAARFGPAAVAFAMQQLQPGEARELVPEDVTAVLLGKALKAYQIEAIEVQLPPAWREAAKGITHPRTTAKYINLIAAMRRRGAAADVLTDESSDNATGIGEGDRLVWFTDKRTMHYHDEAGNTVCRGVTWHRRVSST